MLMSEVPLYGYKRVRVNYLALCPLSRDSLPRALLLSHTHGPFARRVCAHLLRESDFAIDNLMVQIHFIIVMIRWIGLAPWELEFPFLGSITSTFLGPLITTLLSPSREIGNLLPNNRRQRRTCYALCHILYPVSAAHTSIFRMDSNSTSYRQKSEERRLREGTWFKV